jgi:hypothetical protein
MGILSKYHDLGQTLHSGNSINVRTLYSLFSSLPYSDPRVSSAVIHRKPHLVFYPSSFSDENYRFVFGSSTKSKILGIPNIPFNFNESIDTHKTHYNYIHTSYNRYLTHSICHKNILSDKLLTKIAYESGLNINEELVKYYSYALNNYRIQSLDLIINNKTTNIIINGGVDEFVDIFNLSKYISEEQISYFYSDLYELKHLKDDPFVKIGFNITKGVFSYKDLYNIKKYGNGDLENLKINLDYEIFYTDYGVGII